ncbi:hypothetical protein HY612_03635 [Candidatus Roizmanbacteria bacterium]|nr:hypothetical protein [Candidatus Roizmanbacteria bacterium]
MLPKKAIDEYKTIYKKVYGEVISDAEALEQGTRLLNLFKAVYRPIPKQDVKKKEA